MLLLHKADGSAACGGTSGQDGVFSIKCAPGQYVLNMSFMGYKTVTKDISLAGNTDIGVVVLEESQEMLSDVVITAKLTERKADRMVINLAGSPLVAGKNTKDVLKYAPGVWVDSKGSISINGNSNVRVMINDRDVRMNGQELVDYLETLKAEDIVKIEVIPTAGAEYEADSAGGVVHITLKKQALEGMNGSVGVSYSQNKYWGWSPSANLNYKKDKWSFTGRYSHNDRGSFMDTFIYLIPIFLVAMNSFKSNASINLETFAFPREGTFVALDNYIKGLTFGNYPFLKSAGYSLLITIVSAALILLCTSMAAWYIARVGSGFSKLVYYLCVFSMVVPFQMVMFTLARTADTLKLNTPYTIPIIYLGFGAGLAVFMFSGFIKSIPLEIEEAAAIDGCGPIRTYFNVVLPMLKPTMISVGVLEIMWVWNDYLLPYLVLDRISPCRDPQHDGVFCNAKYRGGGRRTEGLNQTIKKFLCYLFNPSPLELRSFGLSPIFPYGNTGEKCTMLSLYRN